MSHFLGVGIFWIGLNSTDLGCWRLTLMINSCTEEKFVSYSFKRLKLFLLKYNVIHRFRVSIVVWR